jgi:hypothetical protein
LHRGKDIGCNAAMNLKYSPAASQLDRVSVADVFLRLAPETRGNRRTVILLASVSRIPMICGEPPEDSIPPAMDLPISPGPKRTFPGMPVATLRHQQGGPLALPIAQT